MTKIKNWYLITKPGIVRGNVIMAAAGFLYASDSIVNLSVMLSIVLGVALVIAGACVANNIVDIKVDAKMSRTRGRALVVGEIGSGQAKIYSVVLTVFGLTVLMAWSNTLTVLLGILAWMVYVVAYGYSKRRSVYGTLIGGIAGALPPVAGYVAVSVAVDVSAAIIFISMMIWQMPHFYTIGIFRLKDYKQAGLPIYSVVNGVDATKRQIIAYICLYTIVTPLLSLTDRTSYLFGIVVLSSGLFWLTMALKDYKTADDDKWARSVFGLSMVVLIVLAVMLSINGLLV